MNITVYLGANTGNDPAFLPAVQELGNWIGANGHALVYGGSKSGLMGALADSVLDAGGHVTGVEPSFFIEAEFQHDGIDDLIVTSDMAERKAKMIELGDVFHRLSRRDGHARGDCRGHVRCVVGAPECSVHPV